MLKPLRASSVPPRPPRDAFASPSDCTQGREKWYECRGNGTRNLRALRTLRVKPFLLRTLVNGQAIEGKRAGAVSATISYTASKTVSTLGLDQ
jgi:hypothetical protein